MSRFLTALYKLAILASFLRCISSECLMYDHTNFDEILGPSKFVNMKYKDIPSEYKIAEPPHGKETGGAFLLGWPEDTEMKKISAPRPTSINISASFWCHSKETTLYLYSECNWSSHDFCSVNGKGWHEDFWYVECSPSTPDPNYFTIRGNTKQKQQAVGYEYLHICTDGATVPPKPTTTEITTTTSYTTTTPESPTTSTTTTTTVDSDSTTEASTPSTTSSSTTTTVDSDFTTVTSTSSTTTTVDSDSTTEASTPSTTSSSKSTTVDSDSTSTATTDESHESTTSTMATTGTATTAEGETTTTTTTTPESSTKEEEEPIPKTTTTEAPSPDGVCGEPVCILGLTVTRFEIVAVSSLIVFLILVTTILVPFFKRRRRIYVTFIKEARPYFVRRRGRRLPGPDVPSRSLSERRRRGGNVNRDSGVRIPRVLSHIP